MSHVPETMKSTALLAEITAADDARIDAILNRDKDGLTEILSDELIYVHSSGNEETKSIYVDRVASGYYDYRSFIITRRDIRVLNTLVFVNGDNKVDIVVDGVLRKLAGRYLMVWRMENARWRLVTFHAASIPRSDD